MEQSHAPCAVILKDDNFRMSLMVGWEYFYHEVYRK